MQTTNITNKKPGISDKWPESDGGATADDDVFDNQSDDLDYFWPHRDDGWVPISDGGYRKRIGPSE